MKKIFFLFISTLLIVSASFAQIQRANKYYDNYDYATAIPLYKKVLKKNKDNVEALEKISNAYRLTKKYQLAEVYYARLMKQTGFKDINHFFYGTVLKNNNKIEQAKEQFQIYLKAAPEDKKAETLVKSCDEIKVWVSKMQEFEIAPIENINTSHSEFSPVFLKNKLVFASSRSSDMVNDESDSWDNEPYLSVYTNEFEMDEKGGQKFSKKSKPLSWRVNLDFHDGPVCYNIEQNVMYITRVTYVEKKKDKNFVNRPKIFISNLNGTHWEKPVEFPYNSDLYTVQHPAISIDNQSLYFASDMPGGEGGMDLYVSKKDGDKWGTPVNLGSAVNTPGNEVFPYIRKDGILYFSSDGHAGFGGLDVFSASKVDNKFLNVEHLTAPLNSSTDDFGIVFSDDFTTGYFSSDRSGGKGLDDIYSFKTINTSIAISGKILFSKNLNDIVANTKVILMTEDGVVVMVSNTDNAGFFKFEKLSPDKKYMVKLDGEDPVIANKEKFYLADNAGKVIRITVVNNKGDKFVFANLPSDPNGLPQLGYDDDVTIAGNILFDENPSKPLANTKLNLVNEKGEIVQRTTTNEFGAFVFTNLPSDQNFLVRVDEGDTELALDTKVVITNKSGLEVQSTTAGEKGGFNFKFLASDPNTLMNIGPGNDVAISGNLMYGAAPSKALGNKKVYLMNEKGEIVMTVVTDEKGTFVFSHLPSDQKFLVKIDETDSGLPPNTKIVITSKNGKEVESTTTSKTGDFKFDFIATDTKGLNSMDVEDSDLHYNFKGSLLSDKKLPIAGVDVRLIDSNGKILRTVKTDVNGNFEIDSLNSFGNSLFELDEKDKRLSMFKKIFLTNNRGEILQEFTLVNGKFRFSLIKPQDTKSLKSLEVEDVDLRYDFRGSLLSELKKPIPDVAVNLVDENGKVLKSVKTDSNGLFEFINLNAYGNTLFELDENDKRLAFFKKIYLTNSKGEIIREFTLLNGKFRFSILKSEQKSLGTLYVNDPWLSVLKMKDHGSSSVTNIENINYDYGKADLLPEAKKTLDKVINIMKNDPKITLVLESHTDSRSSYGFNIKLSRLRSKTAVDYIVANGINKKRVVGKGFGEMVPTNKCKDGVTCTEQEYFMNRRTEFKIKRK